MKNQLQNRGKWTTLFLLAMLLMGGTTIKAQTWAYSSNDKELFKEGTTLKNVTVKEGTEKELVIGNNADLTLTSLDLTGSIADGYIVTEIAADAFSSVPLTSFVCPEDLKVIGDGAFSICISLTSITFNEKLTKIGEAAFDRTIALTSVTFPKSLTSIGIKAFKSCSELATVTVPAESQLTSIGESAFSGCGKLTAFTIPAGLTTISAYTFSNSGLTSLAIPATVKELQTVAFGFCKELVSVTIAPESQLATVGAEAFTNCIKLTSFAIPAQVKTIPASMFSFCGALARIDCDHVEQPTIGSDAFRGGPEDRVVYALKANPRNWDKALWGAKEIIYVGNWVFDATAKTLVNGGVTMNNVTVKEGTEKELMIGDNAALEQETLDLSGKIDGDYTIVAIGDNAFKSNATLTTITLPATLKTIGASAFKAASKLATVTIPQDNQITTIGVEAFAQTAITTFTLPKEVTVISERMFNQCMLLETITFNDKLTEIGASAFEKATALKAVVFPLSLTTLGLNAFKSCAELATVTIPENNQITKLGNGAFNRCEKLTSFTIPAGITKIENFVFSFSGLTSITLSAAITEIGTGSFSYCTALARIDCDQATEPAIGEDAFSGGPSDRIVYALKATSKDWDKAQWGANEIIYAGSAIGTVDGDQVRVWVDGGVLQIASAVAEHVRIISANGISTDLGTISGNTQVALPQGVSIVLVGDRKYKVVR